MTGPQQLLTFAVIYTQDVDVIIFIRMSSPWQICTVSQVNFLSLNHSIWGTAVCLSQELELGSNKGKGKKKKKNLGSQQEVWVVKRRRPYFRSVLEAQICRNSRTVCLLNLEQTHLRYSLPSLLFAKLRMLHQVRFRSKKNSYMKVFSVMGSDFRNGLVVSSHEQN